MDIIKQYQDMITIIEKSKRKNRLEQSNNIKYKNQKLESRLYKTTKELIFKRWI